MTSKEIPSRIALAHTKYGSQNIDYHIGAVLAALREADQIAKVFGVSRIALHDRLEQYAALVYQLEQTRILMGGTWTR